MAKSLTYKRTVQTALKASGIIDTDRMIIDIDNEEKSIATLLSDFNGAYVEVNVKTKDEEELEEPVSDDE